MIARSVLTNKRIAVSGGFGALGLATVSRLREAGALAIAIDLAPVPPGWEGPAFGEIDITDPGMVAHVMQDIQAMGGLDGLVNVAGGFAWQTVLEGGIDLWDRMYRVNLQTALSMSLGAAPLLIASKGAIVNIGAAAAVKATAGMGAYAASKAGVARLTEALADEFKDVGVRVNAVLPSIIDTAANRADMPDADFTRWVDPGALADVIAFLLSEDARAVTGALLPVTGRI